MLFGTRNILENSNKCDTFMNGTKIHYVTNFSYLSIKIGNILTFQMHALRFTEVLLFPISIMETSSGHLVTKGEDVKFYKCVITSHLGLC